MPIGIRPINDFAFKKIFGSAENREALISLLNAILRLRSSIVDVTILNPFKLQDFQDDKLSVVDVKAVDSGGAIYHIEIQLEVPASLVQRIAFYGCELYADQLREGNDYAELRPVYSIWLIGGVLWPESDQVHHVFRLSDAASGRILGETLEIHTIELAKYNLGERDAAAAGLLSSWLYWLRHAQDYEAAQLKEAFPNPAIRRATETLLRISEITEDKTMYDARERAIRDRKWELESAMREARREGRQEGRQEGLQEGRQEGEREGEAKGKIETIRILQGLLNLPLGEEQALRALSLDQLDAHITSLQEKLRNREPS